MRHSALSRVALATAFLIAASAASAHATGPVADRWEARGDRVDHRLDARGHEHRADRLDDRGDRIDGRLDARGDRLERRADRIGQRRQGRRG